MFLAIDGSDLNSMPMLRRSMFVDRADQFVHRHGWPLPLDAGGLEIDEYDGSGTTYCMMMREGRHLASVRLRPEAAGSMVERHFPALWREEFRNGTEITRFCVSPRVRSDPRSTLVPELLLGLCRHCQRAGIDSVFGVVFPSVLRVIKQAGWSGSVHAKSEDKRNALLLVEWIPSSIVAWRLQEQIGAREVVPARGTGLRNVLAA
ncbi:MAG: acyl-homoserine-lactone synthase [Amaricoccus sp.]|uniref:acyl-homoserine-lactone synthase n=1 Tax=Amaricoccus sp. TaxID=1872485 RepID=UPI0039E2832D